MQCEKIYRLWSQKVHIYAVSTLLLRIAPVKCYSLSISASRFPSSSPTLHPTSCWGRKTRPGEGSFPPTVVTRYVIYNVPSPHACSLLNDSISLLLCVPPLGGRFMARHSVTPGSGRFRGSGDLNSHGPSTTYCCTVVRDFRWPRASLWARKHFLTY
jgi:hypothetical protein